MDELEKVSPATRRWRRAAIWAAATFAVAGVTYGLVRPSAEPTQVGRRAPEFALQRLDGSGEISSTELEGGPVIVNFWGSWCIPCREEAPLFEKAWRKYRDEGLTVLGVDLRDAPQNAREFLDEHDITYPIVVDPEEVFARKMGIGARDGLPQTFFVDSDWRFLSVGEGETAAEGGIVVLGGISEELLDQQIRRLLEGNSN